MSSVLKKVFFKLEAVSVQLPCHLGRGFGKQTAFF